MHLKAGQKAPDFSLPGDNGTTVTLADYRGKHVVLYFYPKDDTPGCTKQAEAFRDFHGDFEQLGVEVIGVSKDSVESHDKFKAKYSLPFPLATDPSGSILEHYGVWKEKNMYGKKFMGIERTTFLIDPTGHIVRIWNKVKVDGHAQEVLNQLQ